MAQKVSVYTLFIVFSLIWAGMLLITSVRETAISPRDQGDECEVIRVLNNTLHSLNTKSDQILRTNHPLKYKHEPSVITAHFYSYTAKEKLLETLRDSIRSHTRPDDMTYNYNVTESDRLPVDRGIPDTRPVTCHHLMYDVTTLPTASIVIPFYNEALSMLLRTVYSILHTSPDVLIQDITLVDDCSQYDYLRNDLEQYLSVLPKVRLIRNARREGLVRSRLIGAHMARGHVVIFLDAHTEANTGWLEPILQYLSEQSHAIVQPFVDGISQQTLQFSAPGEIFRGATTWDLRYVWTEMAAFEQEQVRSGHAYFSPALIGCAIAVNKHYFDSIGGFDSQQLIWGGENIELSFRAWLCGGQIVTIPCSRVGHLFREIPYRHNDPDWIKHLHSNQIRVAEVWMDEYKHLFYASTTVYKARNLNLTAKEWKSLQERKHIRETLKCKPFRWYLENVVPDIPIPPHNARYHGEIMNLRTRACWEVQQDGYVTMNYYCFEHRILVRNFFSLDTHGFLLFRDKCVKFEFPGPALRVRKCPSEAEVLEFGRWSMRYGGDAQYGHLQVERQVKGQVRTWCIHQVTSVTAHAGAQMPQSGACDVKDPFQKWAFTYRFDKLHDVPIL